MAEKKNNAGGLEQKLSLSDKSPAFVFWIFRYVGMAFIGASMVFLFQKEKPPLFSFRNLPIENGPFGNILLLIGIIFFGVYFISKIYYHYKS